MTPRFCTTPANAERLGLVHSARRPAAPAPNWDHEPTRPSSREPGGRLTGISATAGRARTCRVRASVSPTVEVRSVQDWNVLAISVRFETSKARRRVRTCERVVSSELPRTREPYERRTPCPPREGISRPAASRGAAEPGGAGRAGRPMVGAMSPERLTIDIWSDVACPWCHVGKRRLEAALAEFPERDRVVITWRAFELDTSAPRELDTALSYATRLARKYGCSEAEAAGMIANMTKVARSDGLDFRFDVIRPGNTFDAHRLIHLAGERGKQDAVKERFLVGYLSEGARIGDPETLARLAVEAGLDATEVREVLAGAAYADEVRADEDEASELGIRGVPFFVLGGKYAISGAQPASVFRQALRRTWDEVVAPRRPELVADGAFCGPEGC